MNLAISKIKIFFLLFFVCFFAYANSLTGEFLSDDNILIVNNPVIQNLKFIPHAFISNLWGNDTYSYYRPLQAVSFALDYLVYKFNTAGYHFTNIVIHSANAFLFFSLLLMLFNNFRLAVFASILFCAHPIHTESVAFISGRSELLVSLFSLLTIVFYLYYLKKQRGYYYLFSIISFVCVWLSREVGFAVLIPFMILFLGLRYQSGKKQVWIHFISLLGIIGVYLILRFTFIAPIHFIPYRFLPFKLEFLNFWRILFEYFRLIIAPYQLHIFRTVTPLTNYWSVNSVWPLGFFAVVVIALILSVKNRRYVISFGISWFVLGLAYLIRFMYKFTGTLTMEEHWVYLPSMGLFLVFAYGLLNISVKRIRILLISCALSIFFILTVVNNRHYRNEVDFYRYSLRMSDPSKQMIIRSWLVTSLFRKKEFDSALSECRVYLENYPGDWRGYIYLGGILKEMKDYSAAEGAYRDALKIDPFCSQAYLGLDQMAEETGRNYEIGGNVLLEKEKAIIYCLERNDFHGAFSILYEELSKSESVQLYTLAGITFGKVGRYSDAISAFKSALKIDPANMSAMRNLIVAYKRTMQFKKASLVEQELYNVITVKKRQ